MIGLYRRRMVSPKECLDCDSINYSVWSPVAKMGTLYFTKYNVSCPGKFALSETDPGMFY